MVAGTKMEYLKNETRLFHDMKNYKIVLQKRHFWEVYQVIKWKVVG